MWGHSSLWPNSSTNPPAPGGYGWFAEFGCRGEVPHCCRAPVARHGLQVTDCKICGVAQTPLAQGKVDAQMPFFIFKLTRRSAEAVVMRSFPDVPLAEAETYRKAEAQLRELRRAAEPGTAFYYLVYGDDEQAARERLEAQ